jgi:hypothetical protein
MDLGRNPLQRAQSNNTAQAQSHASSGSVSMPAAKASKLVKSNIAAFVLVCLVGLLLFLTVVLTGLGNKSEPIEDVKSDRYQAVFISGGIGYFGKITEMNKSTIIIEDVYYLRSENAPSADGKTTQQTVTLAKLEKELIGPESKMFINRDQVLFWENLRDDGQVADAIRREKNGEGNTTQQTNSTNANTATTPATNSSTNTTSTTPASTPVTPPATPSTPAKKP